MVSTSLSRCSLAATEIGTSSVSSSHHIYRFDRGDTSILLRLLPRKGKQNMKQGSAQSWDEYFFQPFDCLLILLFSDFNCGLGNSAYANEVRWVASYKNVTSKLSKMSFRVWLYGRLLDNVVVTCHQVIVLGEEHTETLPGGEKATVRWERETYHWWLAAWRASAKCGVAQ